MGVRSTIIALSINKIIFYWLSLETTVDDVDFESSRQVVSMNTNSYGSVLRKTLHTTLYRYAPYIPVRCVCRRWSSPYETAAGIGA